MAKIIAIANQKGGVGKTSTCVNLACGLKKRGRRVLLVDCDAQGNATSGMGVDKSLSKGVYTALIGELPPAEVVVHTRYGDVMPSNKALAGAGVEMIGMERREYLLRDALEPLREAYDFILIDCSPSLGIITVNALTASDSVIIPVQSEYFALEGISQLLNTIRIIKSRLRPSLEIEGFLLTMYDARLRLANQIYEELKGHFGDMVFRTVIPRNIKLSESPSHGLPVILYDPDSRGAIAYTQLARELLARGRRKTKEEKRQ